MICGLPGTGKTTIARQVVNTNSSYVVHSLDEVRKDLGFTAYDEKRNFLAFIEFNYRMVASLKNGSNVIADTNFTTKQLRREIYEISKYYQCELMVVECVAPEQTAKKRIQSRVADYRVEPQYTETNDPEVFDRLKTRWEPFDVEALKRKGFGFLRLNTESKQILKQIDPIFDVFHVMSEEWSKQVVHVPEKFL